MAIVMDASGHSGCILDSGEMEDQYTVVIHPTSRAVQIWEKVQLKPNLEETDICMQYGMTIKQSSYPVSNPKAL